MNTLDSLRNLLAGMRFGALINSKYQIVSFSFYSSFWKPGEGRGEKQAGTVHIFLSLGFHNVLQRNIL